VPGLLQGQTAPPWLEPDQDPKPGEEREDVPFDSFRLEHHQDDCGEIFGWQVAERRYFVPPRRCEQGPLQLRVEWEPSAYTSMSWTWSCTRRARSRGGVVIAGAVYFASSQLLMCR